MELLTITGPPGTGKTTTVSKEVASCVKSGVDRSKVLVASLTRGAAREAARVVELPERQVGTWHSFAYHALGEPALTETHLKDWGNQYPKWAITGKARMDVPDYNMDGWGAGDRLMLEYSRVRAQCLPKDHWRSGLLPFAQAWEDWKKQCGYSDFSDLIDRARDVETAPGAPSVIFVDEAQDISVAEARLIAHWAGRADRLVLAGDDHQAIYGWRGSDPIAVREVWARMKAPREARVLDQSYRLSGAVHKVAMAQMARCTPLEPVAYLPREEAGAVYRSTTPFKKAEGLIRHALANTYESETVMFIASCGYMLDPVMRALHDAGEAWHNPWRPAQRRWNPLGSAKGPSLLERCQAFMRPSQELYGEDAAFWTADDVKLWAGALAQRGTLESGAKNRIAGLPRSMPVRELAGLLSELFTPEARERIVACDLKWYLSALETQRKKQVGAKLLTQLVRSQGEQAIVKPPRFVLGTIHSLKGAEADVVYVCPEISAAAMQGAMYDNRAKEELQRVFYVAVTRARRALVLCQPATNMYVAL